MEKPIERLPVNRYRRVGALSSIAIVSVLGTGLVTFETPRTSCADTIDSLSPYKYTSTLPDITSNDLLDSTTLETHLESIDDLYGIAITFADPVTKESAPRMATTLNGAVAGFEELSPALTNALNINDFVIAENVVSSNGTRVGGTYTPNENDIVIRKTTEKGAKQTTIHELWHATDYMLLCPTNDVTVDTPIAENGLIEENSDPKVDPVFYMAHGERQFASLYGTTDILEDRATQVEDLFTTRGIIQPYDPDFNSPYHVKQVEILRRLEMLLPGVHDHLQEKTFSLRKGALDLTESIENPFKPGELSNVGAIVANAYINNRKVEQLRNTTVSIDIPDHEVITIKNPLVIRDTHGEMKGFSWTPLDTEKIFIDDIYFDPTYVKIHYTPESYVYTDYIQTTDPDGIGYMSGGIKVGEVWAREIATTPNSLFSPSS